MVVAAKADGLDPEAGAPCVFKGCRASLHVGAASVGVVLCSSWGFEDLATRESLRGLATAIAQAGYSCLRFDYPCTGESPGGASEVDDRQLWVASINDAADFLRAYTGVKRFVFIGQSLGAALAMEAASSRSDVAHLVALTPVTKGKAYLRDLAAAAKRLIPQGSADIAGTGPLRPFGFALSAAMAESLRALDVTRLNAGDLTHVTIFDRADRQAGAEFLEHCKRIGVAARFEAVDRAMAIPTAIETHQPLAASASRIVAVLTDRFPVGGALAKPRVPLLPATARAERFREECVTLGPAQPVSALLCQPLAAGPDAPAVVMIQPPNVAAIGWARTAVDQARALAGAGCATLRLDVSASIAIVRDAVDWFAARGHARIALVGVGEGGDLALAAAAGDARVSDVLALNPAHLGCAVETDEPEPWLALRGKLAALCEWLPADLRAKMLREATPDQVMALFGSLFAQATRVSLVYSDNDPSLLTLRGVFGPMGRELVSRQCAVTALPGADHWVTDAEASARLQGHLIAFLSQPSLRDERAAAARKAETDLALYAPARSAA